MRLYIAFIVAIAVPGLSAQDSAAVKGLEEKLRSTEAAVRLDAIRELEKLGRAAQEVVPALIDLLKTAKQGSSEYTAVLQAVTRIGLEKQVLPALLNGMKGNDQVFANSCWRLLSLMGTPALEGVVEAAKDRQPAVRFYALSAITLMKDKPANVVLPVLIERLDDKEPVVRSQAGIALASLGGSAEPAVPALIKSLAAKNMGAALALEHVGPAAKDAVPALRKALADTVTSHTINLHSTSDAGKVTQKVVTLAEYAASALGKIGPEAKAAVPDLFRAMAGIDGLRLKVVLALGEIGPVDKTIVPGLAKELVNPQQKPDIQRAIVAALGKMGNEAVPALVRILQNGAAAHCEMAAQELGRLGEAAEPAVPNLTFALRHTVPAVRGAAAMALGAIGPPAKSALPSLRQLAAAERDPKAKQAAINAVAKLSR